MLPFAVRVCSIYRKSLRGCVTIELPVSWSLHVRILPASRIYTEKAIFNLLLQCKFEGNMLKLPPL